MKPKKNQLKNKKQKLQLFKRIKVDSIFQKKKKRKQEFFYTISTFYIPMYLLIMYKFFF